ncbi:unnamed protein product [Coccothraustes coccothraustes]
MSNSSSSGCTSGSGRMSYLSVSAGAVAARVAALVLWGAGAIGAQAGVAGARQLMTRERLTSPLRNSCKRLLWSSQFYSLNQRCHAYCLALVKDEGIEASLPLRISIIACAQQHISANHTPGNLQT